MLAAFVRASKAAKREKQSQLMRVRKAMEDVMQACRARRARVARAHVRACACARAAHACGASHRSSFVRPTYFALSRSGRSVVGWLLGVLHQVLRLFQTGCAQLNSSRHACRGFCFGGAV
eukprot:1650605-Pleurochrysis_carterae.AAC.1